MKATKKQGAPHGALRRQTQAEFSEGDAIVDGAEFIHQEAKTRQRGAVLVRLRVGPLNSVEAREQLGCLHVAGRVLELRKAGYDIATVRSHAVDAAGRRHPVACYVLRGEVSA